MRYGWLTLVLGTTTLLTAGCGLFGGGDEAAQTDQDAAEPVPQAQLTTPVEEPSQPTPQVPAELIRPINSDARAQQLTTGQKGKAKANPFSVVVAQAVAEASPTEQQGGIPALPVQAPLVVGSLGLPTVPVSVSSEFQTPFQLPQLPPLISQGIEDFPEVPDIIGPDIPEPPTIAQIPPGGGQPGGTQPGGTQPGGTQPGGGTQPLGTQPLSPPAPPEIAKLPPVPQPDNARGVEVKGVVQVGNEVQAIVKAPLEKTTRYVKVGDRLSNGTVLVKRIILNEGSNPTVVLEENGIEVTKRVGEAATLPEGVDPS